MNIFHKVVTVSFVIITLALSLTFNSCNSASKYNNRDLFVGYWREVRHDETFDDRNAIELKLNADSTYKLYIHSERTRLTGTWSLGSFDTTSILVLKYQLRVRDMDSSYYGGSQFPMYYMFKVNNAVKGKLYLVNMSSRYGEENIREHLFKPVE
jgi:hypothetical protein